MEAQFPGEHNTQAKPNHLEETNLNLTLSIVRKKKKTTLNLSKVHLPKTQHIQTEHKSKQRAS